MRPLARLSDLIDRQRGALFPWAPVGFGLGIALYFALPAEPPRAAWIAMGLVLGAGALATTLTRLRDAPLAVLAFLVLAGLCASGLRTGRVDAPILAFRYYGPIEGRIVAIDRSASDHVRLTLDRVVLKDVPPARTPGRVRVALHGDQGWITPEPGLTVILTGHLAAPSGPVEPGGFDFQRQAFFQGLGAVGYTRTPVLALRPAGEGKAGLLVHRARMALSAAVQAEMPGRAGAFAAAITTGDRAGMDAETLEALRVSNLAHLLAISGLHMGLLTGFVFAALRYGLAAVPPLALRWPTKKIAALGALAAGAVYLALSGGNVATERAYIMVAVMLTAVLFDRRALTLRAVAMAALVVLVLRPEQMMGPGFQMSFAATIALIAVFAELRDRETRLPRWARPIIALLVSSAVAGIATAPFAAAHFNRVPHYGLLANTLSVPLMGLVIIPGAVIAACLAPLGLHGLGLALMRPAIEWILLVADRVAALQGAVSHVPAPPPGTLGAIALGSLVLVLWRGPGRLAGLPVIALALLAWSQTERPPVLVTDSGGLIGVLTPEGRALSKARGDGFAAASWLENDGDPADQAAASERAGLVRDGALTRVSLGQGRIAQLSGRGAADRLAEACTGADLVILAEEAVAPAGCRLIDREALRVAGALAIWEGAPLRVVTARERAGTRPWNEPQ